LCEKKHSYVDQNIERILSFLSTLFVTQVDRLKVEGFQGQIMSDHTKLRVFELADQVKVLVCISYLGFLHSEMINTSAFSLQPNRLSRAPFFFTCISLCYYL